MASKGLSRRAFLRAAGVVSVGAAAAACVPVAAPAPAQPPAAQPTAAEEAAPTQAAAPAAAPVTLQFWSEGFSDWVQKEITAYKQVEPQVTIDFVTFQWGEMTPKLLTASAGGTAPNCVIQDRFRMAGWSSRGGATELGDYITQYNINPDDYWPATWAEGVWQGKVYCIPFETDGRFVFWNKDLVAAAGLDPEQEPPTYDWAGVMDMAKKLTKLASDGSVDIMGFVPSQMLNYGNGGDYVYAWADGGEFMKDDKTAWLDNPKLVETLQWELDCVNAVGGIDKTAAFAAGWPTTAGYSPFGAGKLVLSMDGDWNLSNFAKYYPDLKFGMAPWHVRNDKEKVTGFAGGFCFAIPAGAKELPASFKWLNYISSYEAQVDEGISEQNIPCLKKAALSDDLINSSPYPDLRRLANESMQYARFRPITPVGQMIQDLWTYPGTGRDWALYGQKTPEQACADMQAQVQKALDDYWASASG
jgi:multiple sugar transport system substrate-binding protein